MRISNLIIDYRKQKTTFFTFSDILYVERVHAKVTRMKIIVNCSSSPICDHDLLF